VAASTGARSPEQQSLGTGSPTRETGIVDRVAARVGAGDVVVVVVIDSPTFTATID